MNQSRVNIPLFDARPGYYAYVAHGYDLIAESYDQVEAQNSVGRRLRMRMQETLFRTFHPGDRILEIGCGTGIEGLALASRGVDVVATDISERMIEQVRSKAERQDIRTVELRCLPAREIGRLVNEFGQASFDGAYSHGGVLNMDPRLPDVAAGLAGLVKPGGRFVCTVVNQTSLFEVLFYTLVLRPRKSFRRLGNVVPIPITRLQGFDRYVVPTRFFSPRAFFRFFEDSFSLRRLEGLQIFLPPWNLSDYVDRLAPIARAVEAVENRLAHKAPFNAWGSLFLMELERVRA